MELKSYQKEVIADLKSYLGKLQETNNISDAYIQHWNSKEVPVGLNGVPVYNNLVSGTPDVCFKVPTSGGKTFLACNAIKPIFDALQFKQAKVVVWLVPSDSILEQTLKALRDPHHPYRMKINTDFGSRVEVYEKSQLLAGQNFNPTSVNEQMSILVLSYDSFRSKSKEARKVYQENGNLSQFAMMNDSKLETTLVDVIRELNPIVIVDESHHAKSKLSIEMLRDLNPCFILDLTATPAENSNIISYVDALKLKKENMVKLPVIAYNRNSQQEVIADAISLRNRLEMMALEEEKQTGKYIRPIVLFQAEPKGKEDSTTFEKLRDKLVEAGIPKSEIAIKTATINEIKNIDLLSKKCEIRYIITVNALKEGWDCPFAYILATIANKTSKVDVEQILGRVLRQPYAKKHTNEHLNLSYVLTSSNDFSTTLDTIIKGLNNAGFSKKDFRIANQKEIEENLEKKVLEQIEISQNTLSEGIDEIFDFNPISIKNQVTTDSEVDSLAEMMERAIEQNIDYMEEVVLTQDTEQTLASIPNDVREFVSGSLIREEFELSVQDLNFPQFVIERSSLFGVDYDVLKSSDLLKGFTLADKDTQLNFENLGDDARKIDIVNNKDEPELIFLKQNEIESLKQYFSNVKDEELPKRCTEVIYKQLESINNISDRELKAYILRVMEQLPVEHLYNITTDYLKYANKIKQKIASLQEEYKQHQFNKLIEQDLITVQPQYKLSSAIHPLQTISLEKSLYTEEEFVSGFERAMIERIIKQDNVKWWHRNKERSGFFINGALNHYPDFIVMTQRGNVILIETKGQHLKNEDSVRKLELGKTWQNKVNGKFKYYMLFEDNAMAIQGSYAIDDFLDVFKGL